MPFVSRMTRPKHELDVWTVHIKIPHPSRVQDAERLHDVFIARMNDTPNWSHMGTFFGYYVTVEEDTKEVWLTEEPQPFNPHLFPTPSKIALESPKWVTQMSVVQLELVGNSIIKELEKRRADDKGSKE